MASEDSLPLRLEAALTLVNDCRDAQAALLVLHTLQEIVRDPEFGGLPALVQSWAHCALGLLYARSGDRRQAMAALRRAVECGYEGYRELSTEEGWASLRGDPEFERLLGVVQSRGDYEMLLRRYADYDESEPGDPIAFAYQASHDPDLAQPALAFSSPWVLRRTMHAL